MRCGATGHQCDFGMRPPSSHAAPEGVAVPGRPKGGGRAGSAGRNAPISSGRSPAPATGGIARPESQKQTKLEGLAQMDAGLG